MFVELRLIRLLRTLDGRSALTHRIGEEDVQRSLPSDRATKCLAVPGGDLDGSRGGSGRRSAP